MSQLSTAVKMAITVVTFLVAIAIASAAFRLLLGSDYPAWTLVAALAITAPVIIVLWRDRLN